MSEYSDIESLLQKSKDELFLDLGKELVGKSILPKSRNELISTAKIWWERNIKLITDAICGSEKLRKLLLAENNDDVVLVTAIADLVSGLVTGVSPVTVAALLVKKGVNNICKEN